MIKKLIKWKHFYFVLFLVVLALLITAPFLNLNNSKRGGDWRNSDTPGYHFIKKVVLEDKSWPLWDHMTFSGRPMAGLGMPLLYPIALILGLFFSAYAMMNLMLVLHTVLAGVSMYFLAYHILKNRYSALVAGTIYGFSPYLMAALRHPFWVYGVAFIPLEFLLAIKAFKSKHFLKPTILLGIVSALHFLSAGVLQWYYAVMFVAGYFVFKMFGKNWKARVVKSLIILFVFFVVMISLSSIRFIPSNEFTSYTNRGSGLPVEEIRRVGHVNFDNFIDTFIYPIDPTSKAGSHKYGEIGLMGIFLAIFGLYCYFKKKEYKDRKKDMIIYLILAMVGITIFASGAILELIYNLPGVSSQRGLDRSLIIFVLCGALLAGYGVNCLAEKMNKRRDNSKKKFKVYASVLFLVLLTLFIVNLPKLQQQAGEFEHYSITENSPLFLKMAEDNDVFRFHVLEVRGIDWNNFLGSSIPHDLESVYGTYGGGWDARYFNVFLASTFRSPAKLWGMLNVKYIVSSEEINSSDYSLVEFFDDIPHGTISGAFEYTETPNYDTEAYLYENNNFLPRAFIPSSAVLAVGHSDYANQLMYALMLTDSFDPSKTTVVLGEERINDHKITELRKYDAIFLTQGSVDQNSLPLLEKYKEEGGILVPDVTEGENSVPQEGLEKVFADINNKVGGYTPVEIVSYYDETPNYMKINVDNKESTLLFVSDKYTLYPGWTAKVDGDDTEIITANGVLSAIYLPAGAKEVEFEYYPGSFKKGLIITTLALLVLIVYFAWPLVKKIKKRL